MEVFRTDGGGRSDHDERLTELLIEFCKIAPDKVINITKIHDHKGDLKIEVNPNSNIDYYNLEIYNLFSYLWSKQNEHNVSVYMNDVCFIGHDKENNFNPYIETLKLKAKRIEEYCLNNMEDTGACIIGAYISINGVKFSDQISQSDDINKKYFKLVKQMLIENDIFEKDIEINYGHLD